MEFVLTAMLGMVSGTVGVTAAKPPWSAGSGPNGAAVTEWLSSMRLQLNEQQTDRAPSGQSSGPDGRCQLC